MANNKIAELETEPVGKLLIKYALPAIAGMVVMSLYNIVDSVFIGQWVGEYALSGLAVAFPVMNLTIAVGTLFGIGGAAICSIRLGEKNYPGAQLAFGNVFSLGLIVGIPLALLGAFFLEEILLAFGASEQTLPYAYSFMLVILLGMPITNTFFNLNHIVRASGAPNRSLAAMCLSVGVNVALAPLFIKVFGWGIFGAAFATITAQVVGLVFVLKYFFDGKGTLRFRRGIYYPRMKTVLPVISIGSAPSILNACGCFVVVVINYQLLKFGGDLAVGAHGIFTRVVTLIALFIVGLTQGMQPIVGYNHGACRYDRVQRALLLTLLAGTAVSTAGVIACELFPHAIARAFTDEPTLIGYTVRALRIAPAAFALVGGQIVLNNFFQSIGRGKTAAVLSTTRQLLFFVPCVLIFPKFWGQYGVWVSFPVADLLAVVVTAVAFVVFLKNYARPKVVMKPKFERSDAEPAVAETDAVAGTPASTGSAAPRR